MFPLATNWKIFLYIYLNPLAIFLHFVIRYILSASMGSSFKVGLDRTSQKIPAWFGHAGEPRICKVKIKRGLQ